MPEPPAGAALLQPTRPVAEHGTGHGEPRRARDVVPGAEPDRAARRPAASRVLLSLAVLAAAGAVVASVPGIAGTSWRAVAAVVSGVDPLVCVALVLLWAAGLWCYSWVLTAALPGLTRGRAMLLNLSGSAVANVLPLGGAAGVALNAAMTTSWGHSRRETASFTVISNVVDVAGKIVVAGGILLVSALVLRAAGTTPLPGAQALLLSCGVVALAGVLLLGSSRACGAAGRVVHRLLGALVALRARRRGAPVGRGAAPGVDLVGFRRHVLQALRTRWRPFSAGVLGYLALQGVLMAACLHVAGVEVAVGVLLTVFAVDRLATMLPVTPSGTGFAEAGAAAVLLAAGVPPAPAVAGVLLYRAFIVLLEIPVGGLALAGWLVARRASPVPR